MPTWKITIPQSDLNLKSLYDSVRNRRGLMTVLGAEGKVQVQRNFRQRAGVPNKLGAPSTGYWESAAQGTSSRLVSDTTANVSVNQVGIRLHLLGGTVRPVTRKYLTIPAIAEAHGKRATEIPGLFVLRNKAGFPCALARHEPGHGKSDFEGVVIYFWLVKSAKHRPDPTVLPSTAVLGQALRRRATAYYQRELQKAARGQKGGAN
jgi:hypothetical protein